MGIEIDQPVRKALVTVATLFLGFGLLATPSSAASANSDLEPQVGTVLGAGGPGTIKDSYVVMLRDEAVSTANVPGTAAFLAERFGGEIQYTYSSQVKGFSVEMTAAEAKRLAADPHVESVTQDKVVQLLDTTQTSAPWNLDRIDQTSPTLSGTYSYSTAASNVTAYVLDTGVRLSHSQFGGRATSGWDFVDGDADASDCQGHGTHVAGTIAGSTYGVAKAAKVVSVRVLDCNGSGSYSGIIAGIDWVTRNVAKPAVVNLSLGGAASTALDDAVASATAAGITFVVAAGNSNADACQTSPARAASAITVGATDLTDARASFSNFGSCVDIFAPGVNVTSSANASDIATATMSGTSMASPDVAGVAALYLAAHPAATAAQVATALLGDSLPGVVAGAGTASPNKLLHVNLAAPSTPTTPPPTMPVTTPPVVVAPPAAPVIIACNIRTNGANINIPAKGQVLSTVAVSNCAGKASKSTRVSVSIVHARRGDLQVELVAPNGKAKTLKAANKKDKGGNVVATYTANMATVNKNGVWKLRVKDNVAGVAGYIDSWTLTV